MHGEGAETIGNSTRGSLSAGLTGATTTRGGQQGGIGASVYDSDTTGSDAAVGSDGEPVAERDLTLGTQFGGAMEDPEGPISSAINRELAGDEVDDHL